MLLFSNKVEGSRCGGPYQAIGDCGSGMYCDLGNGYTIETFPDHISGLPIGTCKTF